MDWYRCGLSGGSARNYTNGLLFDNEQQITDISNFTKVYNTSVAYGSNGTKIATALGITDETTLTSNMSGGWQGIGSCYYEQENLTGAYGGYIFGEALNIQKAKFWIGRYSEQNKSLYVTVQWLDANNNWNNLKEFNVSTDLPYPTNIFEIYILKSCYGIRWIHNTPTKSSGNNVVFFGMTLYEGTGTSRQVYVPEQSGLNEIPQNYSGFGEIYII